MIDLQKVYKIEMATKFPRQPISVAYYMNYLSM